MFQAQSLSQSIRNLINCPIVLWILSNKTDEMRLKLCRANYLTDYPDQVDGLNRLAMVYEARGEKRQGG